MKREKRAIVPAAATLRHATVLCARHRAARRKSIKKLILMTAAAAEKADNDRPDYAHSLFSNPVELTPRSGDGRRAYTDRLQLEARGTVWQEVLLAKGRSAVRVFLGRRPQSPASAEVAQPPC